MRMIDHEIELTYSGEKESRERRLSRTLGYVIALASQDGMTEMYYRISALNDHKGDLTVTWRVPPTQREKDYFTEAWGSGLVGDGGGSVRHEEEDNASQR